MIREIPYKQDSTLLYQLLMEYPWAIFLDSGFPRSDQGRFDILSAKPYRTLITRGGVTEISGHSGIRTDAANPFQILKSEIGKLPIEETHLPFLGGAIGYFGYDLARRLEEIPEIAIDLEKIPEMMVGIFDWAIVVDHQLKQSWLVQQNLSTETLSFCDRLLKQVSQETEAPLSDCRFRIHGEVTSNMSRDEYGQAFRRIKQYLREGDCYQVNLAQRFSVECEGDSWSAYKILREINAAPFSAYLNFPGVRVLSSSPERFLRVDSTQVETKPIKGTRPRINEPSKDQEQITALKNSLKDRAENLMIVDLLRNDIGKTCKPGSVTVPRLFDIESFATVHHMVSTVRGQLADGLNCIDLLKDCFPGGSITGAPKIRAMEIIEELEPNRRGVYCGSIGYIGYDGNMDTSITIRTLVHSDNQIRFWAGGGIVADSREEDEYQESFDKAAAMLNLLKQLAPAKKTESKINQTES